MYPESVDYRKYWLGPLPSARTEDDAETNPALNTVDDDFIDKMIPHHEMAITMAKKEIAKGKNPSLIKMAKAIVSGQGTQITQLKALQKLDT